MPKYEFFSDIALQFTQERAHARLIGWAQGVTGITDFNLGVRTEPGTEAMKELLAEAEDG